MKAKSKKLQENLYPNYVIKQGKSTKEGEDVFDGYTVALSFQEQEDGKFKTHFHEIKIKVLGGPQILKQRLKEYVETVMTQGEPFRDPLFTKEGFRIKTPIYKTMTEDEVKSHFKKCNILYSR